MDLDYTGTTSILHSIFLVFSVDTVCVFAFRFEIFQGLVF